MKKRRDFMKASALLVGSLIFKQRARAAQAAGKPNIIFVFADQHRADCMGCYGNSEINTPNFDQFSSEGMLFENCVSPTPVCAPMRVANVTGKLGCKTTTVVNATSKLDHAAHYTVANAFKDAGYKCGYVGKWHMGNTQTAAGDPQRFGFDDYWRVKNSHAYYKWTVTAGPDKNIEQKGFSPESMVDFGMEFIKQSKDNPFCLYLSWGPPHSPLSTARRVCAL